MSNLKDKPARSLFFSELTPLRSPQKTFDSGLFRPAPDDWCLVVTDIVDSTTHINNGRHKTINFVAAMAITALKNICSPRLIPFLFGGDGAVVMIPPEHKESARIALARARGQAARDFDVELRVGLIEVEQLRQFEADVLVARYEPSPGNSFGLFSGGGVGLLENAIRQRGNAELTELSAIDERLDDGGSVDLQGLSCNWNELQSQNGKMVTLIINADNGIDTVYSTILNIAGEHQDPRPVKFSNLGISWPPAAFLLEARARRHGGSLAISVLRVLFETLLAKTIFAAGRPVGQFDPTKYTEEIANNTDFCRFDDTLCFVIDCAQDRIKIIEKYLKQQQVDGAIQFGMHVSDTALMTCLVTSTTDNLHVHFVDGGSGGYTEAAKQLKASAA